MKSNTVLWMVIPCYNEEVVLPKTAPMFLAQLNHMVAEGQISDESRILFVNDGSSDDTWKLIENFSKQDNITISIDCDGQDDIHAMEEMVKQYHEGSDIVYGVRNNRDTDSWFKRTTAQSYYKLLNRMDVEVVYNHADYRLVSSKVLHYFADFHEVNLFLRGMFPLVGFRSTCVYYKREERVAGKSHYPLSKMLHLAFDGITSLSIKPIQMIAGAGLFISIVGFIGIIWVIIRALMGYTIAGWASMICVVAFLGGVQLLSLGVIGTYVGKTYMETKHRPRYIISERTWEDTGIPENTEDKVSEN